MVEQQPYFGRTLGLGKSAGRRIWEQSHGARISITIFNILTTRFRRSEEAGRGAKTIRTLSANRLLRDVADDQRLLLSKYASVSTWYPPHNKNQRHMIRPYRKCLGSILAVGFNNVPSMWRHSRFFDKSLEANVESYRVYEFGRNHAGR
jgi:hypothetical protein